MSKRKKLQDNDRLYNFLRWPVDFAIKRSYSSIKYIGTERIPKDAAVIFAPNHTGALMDALVILAMGRNPKVFIARADIFKNPKLAKLLKFFKMMPIMRMRDGVEEVKKNNKTIEIASDVLKDKVPLCIYPEGTHQPKYSMLPLSKGIFRIALQAKELLGDTPLYIVPVGIRYGNFFRFRSSVRVQIGTPINVGEFVAANSEKSVPEQMNLMRECLEKRIRENIHYIPNNEEYNAKSDICAAMYGVQQKRSKEKIANPLVELNQKTASEIEVLKQEKPEISEKLIALGKEAHQLRNKKRISLKSVVKRPTIISQIARALLLLVTLPYTLFTMLSTLPVSIVCSALEKMFKDKAFHNSVRFVIKLLLWPLLLLIYIPVAIIFLPNYWAILTILALMPAPAIAQDTFKAMRMTVSDFKLWSCKPLKTKYDEIRKLL